MTDTNTSPAKAAMSLSITGNAALDGLILKAIAALAAAGAMYASQHLHLSDPAYTEWLTGIISSGLLMAATAAWGWVNTRANEAKAVQAGVSLVASGKALASDGKTVVTTNDGATPPLAVTVATAQQIIKDFAPASVPKATPALVPQAK